MPKTTMSKRIEVVFTRDLEGVARKGELKSISPGFWRHYLLPKSFAVLADTRDGRVLRKKHQSIEDGVSAAVGNAEKGLARARLSREEQRAKRAARKEKKRAHDKQKAAKMKKEDSQ